MQKRKVIFFLLPVFFILAFNGEVNATGNTKEIAAFNNDQSVVYSKLITGQLPALISPSFYCASAATLPGSGLQKGISQNDAQHATFNYFLLPPAVSEIANGFLQQGKYLFYIYPSHNFW